MKDEAMRLALEALEYPGPSWLEARQPAITAIKQALEQPEPEPVAWANLNALSEQINSVNCGTVYRLPSEAEGRQPLYTSPPKREPLTEREIELLNGMIEVQLHHAKQCDGIANRTMAEKQKGWDMERVALLQKMKAAHGIKVDA